MILETDLIFGLHSIAEAISNPKRRQWEVYGTDESLKELRKLHFGNQKLKENVKQVVLSNHKLQEEGKFQLRERGFKDQRVPSNIFLVAQKLEMESIASIYDFIAANETLKVMALDQVTDIHNLAAILRTAAFYDLDFILISKKGPLNFPPSFFRIASGACEHTRLINCSGLPKALGKMKEKGVTCLGLAEEATVAAEEIKAGAKSKTCLVMGAEDTGLSNATRRVIETFVALPAKGPIRSLNVSVAAAIAMEKFL